MINKIKFKSGPSQQNSPLEAETAPVNVFVGPNNSGKSQVLKELLAACMYGQLQDSKILDVVSFYALSENEALSILGISDLEDYLNNSPVLQPGRYRPTGDNSVSLFDVVDIGQLPKVVLNSQSSRNITAAYTLRLDGQMRLTLTQDIAISSFTSPGNSALAKLFINDDLREKVRQIIYNAIGKYFIIDPTKSGSLRIRFSKRAPSSKQEERSLTNEALEFHGTAEPVDEVSDGIKAFTGIVTALIASEASTILIDEPEAFLHPALAMKLGKEISSLIDAPHKHLFASTHSAAFIMGCIQSRAPINIIRLTYKAGIGTTRLLERDKLLRLMRNPMLRSTGIIEALFHEVVIVTEADADRAFYQEINERLLAVNDIRGIDNCLFVNAQNKQTVWDIVRPLRELGIPAVGLVDLDMVKDGGAEFIKILDNNFIPKGQHTSLGQHRVSVKETLDAIVPHFSPSGDSTKDSDYKKNYWKRNGGVELLDRQAKESALNFFEQLEKYGIFVVPGGELEDWLKYLKIPKGNKKKWLPDMFVRMGEESANADYVNPQAGDIWDFIGRINVWMSSSARLGIPD